MSIPTLELIPKDQIDTDEMRQIMDEHGLGHWNLKIVRTKTRSGRCIYRSKTIEISRYQASGCWRDVLLHEIAHALTPHDLFGHGPLWVKKCIEIGAKPTPCISVSIPKEHTYVYGCVKCGNVVKQSLGKLRKPHIYLSKCCYSRIEFLGEPQRCS